MVYSIAMFEGNTAKKINSRETANDEVVPTIIPDSLMWEPHQATPEQSSDSEFVSIQPIANTPTSAFIDNGVIFEEPIIADEAFKPKRLTRADFLAKNIIARKEAAGYVIPDTSKPSDIIEAIPTETLPRLTRTDFNPTELEKKYTDNVRLQFGLKDPEDNRILAETRNLLLNTITDNAIEEYRPIETLRKKSNPSPTLGYTATVYLPPTPDDSFKPKMSPPLDMRHFQRGQRLPPLTPKGNEPVTPQPGIFKRLKTEFLERFWYR